MSDATNWVRTNDLETTVLNTESQFALQDSTDVVVRDRYYEDYCGLDWASSSTSSGVIGFTTCNHITSGLSCGSGDVRYNNNWTVDVSTTPRRGLACHENGHAVGLKHRAPSSGELGCMTPGPSGEADFTSHDIAHINGYY